MLRILRRRARWLVGAAIAAVAWGLEAGGNLEFARDLFRNWGKAAEWLGPLVASPYSGAIAAALCLAVFGLLVSYDRWGPKENRAEIECEFHPGTARFGPGGLAQKPSADLVVTNLNGPFNLVTEARITGVSTGHTWTQADKWQYRTRSLRGAAAGAISQSGFHMATVETEANSDWVVGIRAEDMIVVQRWQGRGPLFFDLEWTFYNDVNSTLHLIKSVGVRILLADDRKSFVMNVRPSVAHTARLPS